MKYKEANRNWRRRKERDGGRESETDSVGREMKLEKETKLEKADFFFFYYPSVLEFL